MSDYRKRTLKDKAVRFIRKAGRIIPIRLKSKGKTTVHYRRGQRIEGKTIVPYRKKTRIVGLSKRGKAAAMEGILYGVGAVTGYATYRALRSRMKREDVIKREGLSAGLGLTAGAFATSTAMVGSIMYTAHKKKKPVLIPNRMFSNIRRADVLGWGLALTSLGASAYIRHKKNKNKG